MAHSSFSLFLPALARLSTGCQMLINSHFPSPIKLTPFFIPPVMANPYPVQELVSYQLSHRFHTKKNSLIMIIISDPPNQRTEMVQRFIFAFKNLRKGLFFLSKRRWAKKKKKRIGGSEISESVSQSSVQKTERRKNKISVTNS